jgi:hypothetical protein
MALDEVATCRGCGLVLRGKPYWAGGRAYHPDHGRECMKNYYGGFVCSRGCDVRAALELEQSMPGHGLKQTSVGADAMRRIISNWD